MIALQPAGPRGVAVKLKGPCTWAYAESLGWSLESLRRLRVIIVCGSSKSQQLVGKSGSVLNYHLNPLDYKRENLKELQY